jgi:hypothetical protein
MTGRRPRPNDALPPPPEWQHDGRYETVDLILTEERRHYAANGRERGGFGSLNVTLQSEPNSGWTEAGKVPSLLWDEDKAKKIESSNAERIIKLHTEFTAVERAALEQYLLSHLHKGSPYADIAYFIFFVLHRLGLTIAALQAARSHLSGDKVFGYSNVLGLLSAIISREHFTIDAAVFPQILQVLAGESEHNFRLIEKINLARVQWLDRSHAR